MWFCLFLGTFIVTGNSFRRWDLDVEIKGSCKKKGIDKNDGRESSDIDINVKRKTETVNVKS